MTSAEEKALADAKGYAGANRIEYRKHARDRMFERNVTHADVQKALREATECSTSTNRPGRFIVRGTDEDGVELGIVFLIDGACVVITLL